MCFSNLSVFLNEISEREILVFIYNRRYSTVAYSYENDAWSKLFLMVTNFPCEDIEVSKRALISAYDENIYIHISSNIAYSLWGP